MSGHNAVILKLENLIKFILEKNYNYLWSFYETCTPLKESFFSSYKKIIVTCGITHNELRKCKINECLNKHFNFGNVNLGLIDSIRSILRIFRKYKHNKDELIVLASFLVVRKSPK